MSQLPKSGLMLVAENAAGFTRDVGKGQSSIASFGAASVSAAEDVNDFGKQAALIKLDQLGNQLASQKERLALYQTQLEQVNKKHAEGSTAAIAKGNAIRTLGDQISITERKYALMASEINAEVTATKAGIDPSQQLGQAIGAAGQLIGQSADAVARANTTIGTAGQLIGQSVGAIGQAIDSAGQLIDKAGALVATAGQRAADSAPKFSKFGEIATGALRKVGEFAVNTLGTFASKIGGFFTDSIKNAGNFEGSLNRFAAVTGSALAEAGTNIGTFRQQFLDLGRDTQFSAQQAADAANNLAKGGVPIRDIMGDATKATLDLAAAGELELAPAANIVAKQLGVWGRDGVTATDVANNLAAAANASTVNVDDLAIGLANVGGSARVAGVSFSETVQTVGLIAPYFSSASDAGTSFKTFLSRLPGTTKPAIEEMTKLGLYSRETGSAFFDAQGSFIGMDKAAELLAGSTANLSEQQKLLAFNTIFGQDAIRTAAALSEESAAGFDKFGASMTGVGTAADQAALRNTGFNFAMDALGGSVETLQIKLGEKLLPLLTGFINNIIIPGVNLVAGFADSFKGAGEVLSDLFVPAIVGATIAAGAFFAVSSGGGLASFGLAIGLLINQLGTFTIAAGKAALSAAAIAIPLAAIVVAVGATIFAITKFNEKLAAQHKAFMDNSTEIQNARRALEEYNAASAATQENEAIKAEKKNLESLTAQYDELSGRATGAGGFWDSAAAFFDSSEDTQGYIVKLQQLESQIDSSAGKLSQLTGASEAQHATNMELAASEDAVMLSMAGAGDSAQTAGGQFQVTDEILKEAYATMEDIRESGPGIFDSMTQSTVNFQSDMEQKRKAHEDKIIELEKAGNADQIAEENKSYAAQQQQAALSYMEQQAAQRAHLGQMLIDYINAQAQINPAFRTASGQLISAIADEYGVQTSMSDQLFGSMLNDIDEYATTGKGDLDGLIGKLRENETAAVDTQQDMDALAKEYTATLNANFDEKKIEADELTRAIDMFPSIKNTDLLTNFLEGKIDAQELLAEINKLPSQKTIRVHTEYTSSGNPPASKGGATAMAAGGPLVKGRPYLVGDAPGGRLTPFSELFVPSESGFLFNASQTRAMMRGAAGESPFEFENTAGRPAGGALASADIRQDVRKELEDYFSTANAGAGAAAAGNIGTAMQSRRGQNRFAEVMQGAIASSFGDLLARIQPRRPAGGGLRDAVSGVERGNSAGGGLGGIRLESATITPPSTAAEMINQSTVVNNERSYHYAPVYRDVPPNPVEDFHMMEMFSL
jgi:TP901 family phage tail tape measure protein